VVSRSTWLLFRSMTPGSFGRSADSLAISSRAICSRETARSRRGRWLFLIVTTRAPLVTGLPTAATRPTSCPPPVPSATTRAWALLLAQSPTGGTHACRAVLRQRRLGADQGIWTAMDDLRWSVSGGRGSDVPSVLSGKGG